MSSGDDRVGEIRRRPEARRDEPRGRDRRLRDRRGSRGCASWSPARTRGPFPARSGTCTRDSASRSPSRLPCLPRVLRGCRETTRSHSGGSGPCSRRWRSASSSRIGHAELLRLRQLRTRALARPPRSSSSSTRCRDLAAARLDLRLAPRRASSPASVPVITNVSPASDGPSVTSSAFSGPCEVHARGDAACRTRSRLRSLAKNATDALGDDAADARRPPASSSTPAPAMASRLPSSRASACGRARARRGGCPRPTSSFASGRDFDASIASTSSCAERSPMRSSGTSRSTVSDVDVGGVVEQAGVHELRAPAPRRGPRCPCAERPAKNTMRCTRCAGQSTFTQRVSASPSSRTSGWPHTGHCVGNFHFRAPLLALREHRARRPRGSRRRPCAR